LEGVERASKRGLVVGRKTHDRFARIADHSWRWRLRLAQAQE
jgi:hypothetical protein